ncbi:MAG: hypothetical protein D6722_17035 [Bacteroidetes bacterium]|nr:MAG: hypothetical protein D6722_17035 [Bacteroidota bacterium]
MRIHSLSGRIEHRISVNYKVDPRLLHRFLPAPFRPRTIDGSGIAGFCLIRQRHQRIKGLPRQLGLSSDLVIYRIAVEWEAGGRTHSGLYVPRRYSSSRIHALAGGGQIYPGSYRLARVRFRDKGDTFNLHMHSRERSKQRVVLRAQLSRTFPFESVMGDLETALRFARAGQVGYSPRHGRTLFEGLALQQQGWPAEPLRVTYVQSTFFEDPKRFPPGSIFFDHALLVREVQHEWCSLPDLIAPRPIRLHDMGRPGSAW